MPQNKLVKSVKRLKKKLWSPKKRSKKPPSSDWTDQHPYAYLDPAPFLHRRCSCSAPSPSYQYQPSAPPLPPWLEEEQAHYASPGPIVHEETGSRIAAESHRQYAVPEPVYGVPVLTAVEDRRERSGSGGFFGCLSGFGINVIRCFFPCFHIKEVR